VKLEDKVLVLGDKSEVVVEDDERILGKESEVAIVDLEERRDRKRYERERR